MPTKISSLAALASVEGSDYVPIVDASDSSESAQGTTKRSTVEALFTGPKINGYSESAVANATASGTVDLDVATSNVFHLTLTGDITLSLSNVPTGAVYVTLILTQGGTAYPPSWPTIKWRGETVPDVSAINKTHLVTLLTVDGGTNWLGMPGGEF